MFSAAARAVASLVNTRLPGAPLLPHVENLRAVSATVAVEVAKTAADEGLAGAGANRLTTKPTSTAFRASSVA
jgi:malate dehydrogenase (oxaloacetate-decarboxylating)